MLAVDAVVVCQAGMDGIRVSDARLGLLVQGFAPHAAAFLESDLQQRPRSSMLWK